MKKLLIAAAMMGALAAYQASATTLNVNVSRLGGYFTYAGGEFDITSVSPDPTFNSIVANNYVAGTTSIGGGFETFCMSMSVLLQPNPQTGTPLNTVSSGIQYLYRQFAAGTLSGYNYTGTTPADNSGTSLRAQSAAELQAAIWYLEGNSWSAIASEEDNWDSAQQTAAENFVTMAGSASGDYGVRLLYLTYGNTEAQPMLIAVPDGGSTVMLMGIALAGFWLVSRKLQRA